MMSLTPPRFTKGLLLAAAGALPTCTPMAPRVISACACVLLVAAVCAGGLGAVGAAEALGFVSRDGARFVLDGAPFYVTGANQVCLDSLALAGAVAPNMLSVDVGGS